MAAGFCDLRFVDAKFPRQNGHDLRRTEARLTAAHARAGAAFQAVEAACAGDAMDRVDDLPFRDLLAAADDAAVGRVARDEGVVVLAGERLWVEDSGACSDKVGIFCKRKLRLQELRGIFADGGRRAEAGRFDACAVEKAGCVRAFAEENSWPSSWARRPAKLVMT